MKITSKFVDDSGISIMGLIPIIYIYDIDANTQVVNGESMSEINSIDDAGWYLYSFLAINTTHTYTIDVDGGISLDSYLRYQNAIIQPEVPQRPVVDFGN